ncbi:hypothetical protein RND71_000954 [Anisodus tanguticus]|uniref:Myb/SANT-like domain-containing protein n=1 Tax=Anisodus tanguticus TaxID=243964 RepID=A0AAE1SZX6_9SOLA|nr:hypothetical protein RND71_000954 [Anisodus tanguticus]
MKKKVEVWEKQLQEEKARLQRQRDRDAARITIANIKRTVDLDDGLQPERDLLAIIGATSRCRSPPSAPATMRSRPPLTRRRSPIHYPPDNPIYHPNNAVVQTYVDVAKECPGLDREDIAIDVIGIDQHDLDSGGRKTKHKGKNVVWSPAMDKCLIEALSIQARNGNKVDKCFNENAYNAACVAVNSHFSLSLNNQKVVNRLKTIKKRYNIITNILSQEGFSWNPNTNTIECEDDDLWKRYVAAHPDARAFRGKQIAMYEEMKIVCGNYQAPNRLARMSGKVNGNPVVECKYEQESASYLSASSEHMNDSDGTETQSSAKEPVYTEMLANNEDEYEPEAQPEGQAAKRTRSSETLQDAMLAIASSIRHLAGTIEQSKYTIDTPALLQAVMEIEGLEESKQMYAFEFLNEDPVKARHNLLEHVERAGV